MEFAREEERYAPVEIIRSTRSAAMLKVLYAVQDSSTASLSKLEILLQVLIVDTNKMDCVYELTKEYTLARRCVHKNLVTAQVSFKDKRDHLWVVMPLVSRVSLRSMMMSSSAFRHGLPELVAAFVLREILGGLDCIHTVGGNVHGNVSAGCIYMDDTTTVKLAFRALTCEEERTTSFRECELAPELTESSRTLFRKAADIWSFGLLILELVYGEIPVSTYDGLKSFINNNIIIPKSRKFVNRVKLLVGGRNPAVGAERISGELGVIIRECLRQDPKKRPTAKELLEHDYFKVSRGTGSYDVNKVMKQLQKHAIS